MPTTLNGPPRFQVVLARDCSSLDERHPAAAGLLSRRDCLFYQGFPGADETFPLFCYLEQDGRARSYLRCIPDQVTVDGRTYPWAWTADNFTEPDFRGQGLSTLLQQSATEYLHGRGIGRGSVLSTEVTLRIFAKLGFVLVGHARRFLMLRSASPVLDAHVRNAPLRRMLSVASAPIVMAASASLKLWNRAHAHGTVCSAPATFPERELRDLLARLAPRRRVHFAMDADLVRRKLGLAQRAGRHTLHLVHDAESGDCLAYLIVRERFQDQLLAERYRGFNLMTLVDFAFEEGDRRAAAGIVAHLVAVFFKSDCQALEVISSDRAVNDEARRRALRPVGKGMSFNYAVPASWGWPPDLARPEHWPLTHFCGDGFTY